MKFVDETGKFGDKQEMFEDLYQYMQQSTGFDQPCSVHTISDTENANNPLGKTAYYDPQNFKVVLYTDGRHIKDILRSFAHELIHHKQNCEGSLDNMKTPEGYAQEDDNLRQMELEAYKDGNINFRDWEDGKKTSLQEKIKEHSNLMIFTEKEAKLMKEEKDLETLIDIFNMNVEEYKRDPSLENYTMLNDIAGTIEEVAGIGTVTKMKPDGSYDKKTGSLVTKRIWQRVIDIEKDRLEKGLPVIDDPEDPYGTYDPKTGEDPMQKKHGNPFKKDDKGLEEWETNDREDLNEWLSKERQIVHSERLGLKMNLDNLGAGTNKKRLAESMGLHEEVIDRFYNDEDE